MLTYIASNGVRTIIVETATASPAISSYRRPGTAMLRGLGIELIASDSADFFVDATPTAIMVRQILVPSRTHQRESRPVAKLKGARDLGKELVREMQVEGNF